MSYIIAADCGTTSTRAMLFDVATHKFVGGTSLPVGQNYPSPGWVEQDANELYGKTLAVIVSALGSLEAKDVAAVGITNQRETVVAWDRESGAPVCPAIVWQCRRTAEYCKSLGGMAEEISARTGLLPDPYFSATKMKWILDNVPEAKRLLKLGRLCLGTVDSYLIFRLSEGKSFVTDMTNASRTMLYNIHTLDWDERLLGFFGVPRSALPRVIASDEVAGTFDYRGKFTVAGVAGDQQAALIGHGDFGRGSGKITYGTGMFMLLSTGDKAARSDVGLLTTVGASIGKKVTYALEGSVFNAGSSVQWLRDELGLIRTSAESEERAMKVKNTGGVYFVPAFTGLGAPHWASEARASFTGISRGTTADHLIRAVLESIAYSAREVLDAMCQGSGITLGEIGVDGGASANNFLMQFQADVLGTRLLRPKERESTALGAAYLACIAKGLMDESELKKHAEVERVFEPEGDRRLHEKLYEGYRLAVAKTIG